MLKFGKEKKKKKKGELASLFSSRGRPQRHLPSFLLFSPSFSVRMLARCSRTTPLSRIPNLSRSYSMAYIPHQVSSNGRSPPSLPSSRADLLIALRLPFPSSYRLLTTSPLSKLDLNLRLTSTPESPTSTSLSRGSRRSPNRLRRG